MTAFIPNVDLTGLKKFFGAPEQPGPFFVSDTISPILEIQDIALFQRRETLTLVNGSFGSVGQVHSFTVDAGQFWLVHYIAMTTDVLDADQSVTVQLFVIPTGVGSSLRLLVPVSIGNSGAGGIGAAFGRPLILPSGATFGVAINAIDPGAATAIRFDTSTNIHRVST